MNIMAVPVDFSLCRLDRDALAPVLDTDLKALGQRLIDGLQNNVAISLINTGFSFEKLAEVEDLGKRFFSLPETTKMKYNMGDDKSQFHGYTPISGERANIEDPVDFKEVFHLHSLFGKRPDFDLDAPGFRTSMRSIATDYMTLAERSLQCIALAAGFDKDIFKKCYDGQSTTSDIEDISVLKIVNYLPLKNDDDTEKHIRCGRHKDGSLVTLLVPDKVGGLQYLLPSGEWLDVEPVEGAVFLQVGFVLEVLLSGLIKPPEHRVVFKNDDSRVKGRSAVVFFLVGPNETVYKPLDGSDSYTPLSLTVINRKFFNERVSYGTK